MKKIPNGLKALCPLILFAALIVYLAGCKKEIKPSSNTISITGGTAKDAPIPSYSFDWESAAYAPTSPANQVYLPWNSGASAIDPRVVTDFASADGWVMVWNTFSPTTPIANPQTTLFFALYNKFRGVLRFYLYQPPVQSATTYVSHGLAWYTSTSATTSMLNFNAQDIIPSTNQSSFAAVQSQQFNLSGGTWVIFEYEMAYDGNIANTYFPDINAPSGATTQGLKWTSQWISVTQAKFNGSLIGTINGVLEQPQTLGTTLINLSGSAIQGAVEIYGLNNIPGGPTGGNYSSYQNAIQNALGTTISNFFSGIMAGISGGSTTNVNLTINAQINLTGTLVTNGGLEDNKLILPGQINSQTGPGLTPIYNDVMGLFNVTAPPVVGIDESNNWYYQNVDPYDGSSCVEAGVNATAWIDNANIVWNPAIFNSSASGAAVQNLHVDLLALYTSGNYSERLGNWWAQTFHDPTSSAPAQITYSTQTCPSEGAPYTPPLVVRISFEVHPNSGAGYSKITKTFWCNQL